MIKKFYQILLNIFFPVSCFNCKTAKYHLCPSCLSQIKIQGEIIYSTSSLPNLTCYNLCGIIAACDYQKSPLLKEAIHLFKYNRIKKIGEILGGLMLESVRKFLRQNRIGWTVIPLPLYRRKLLERGFNQNDILARACFCQLGAETLPAPNSITVLTNKQNPLKRIKYTKSQTKLSGHERVANVRNVFQVVDALAVKNKNIIIVDDVVTTGATMREAALALGNAGARQVWGLVLAKD
jgi:ComF family protein